jgi:hypothetical protein
VLSRVADMILVDVDQFVREPEDVLLAA